MVITLIVYCTWIVLSIFQIWNVSTGLSVVTLMFQVVPKKKLPVYEPIILKDPPAEPIYMLDPPSISSLELWAIYILLQTMLPKACTGKQDFLLIYGKFCCGKFWLWVPRREILEKGKTLLSCKYLVRLPVIQLHWLAEKDNKLWVPFEFVVHRQKKVKSTIEKSK